MTEQQFGFAVMCVGFFINLAMVVLALMGKAGSPGEHPKTLALMLTLMIGGGVVWILGVQ